MAQGYDGAQAGKAVKALYAWLKKEKQGKKGKASHKQDRYRRIQIQVYPPAPST